METGRADGLDTDGDSLNSLHSFAGPPIPQGEGTSVTRAFLDGNHTLISIMARINPSPDWFVGVDSFQLCVEGNWVDTVTVEVINVERCQINAHEMCQYGRELRKSRARKDIEMHFLKNYLCQSIFDADTKSKLSLIRKISTDNMKEAKIISALHNQYYVQYN